MEGETRHMLAVVNERAGVQLWGDRIAIWTGSPDDPTGLAMTPSAALAAVSDVLRLLGRGDGREVAGGFVERISVTPPATVGGTARLSVLCGDAETVFVMGWADLVGLAEAAGRALNAAPASGKA